MLPHVARQVEREKKGIKKSSAGILPGVREVTHKSPLPGEGDV